MSSRLRDHLAAARRRQFVGRVAEQELFQSALSAPKPPFYILYIFGPGGVGKTSLLREFIYICEQDRFPAIYIDARDIEPSPEALVGSLQSILNVSPPTSPFEFLAAQSRRQVLVIDTYENLVSLDRWLRREFLPQLPDNVLVVLAGREVPALAWRTDPGWQTVVHFLSLRNLTTEESLTYLSNHQVPAVQHPLILNFTHGHPLALSLITDTFAQRRDVNLQTGSSPDIIKTLLEHLVQKVPGPAHRTALEACAIVRLTTEGLLAEMLAMPDAHELFVWLRNLSFVEISQAGLFPHDLVREILVADLRWRNPDWYAELHRRARTYYSRRLQQTTGEVQQRVLSDYIFLHRDNPVVRPFFEWQTGDSPLPDTMQERDRLQLAAMVAQHEGEASADIAAYWFSRQPKSILVFRDPAGQPSGFMAMVALDQTTPEDGEIDPAVQAAQEYLARHTPLRPGEKATLFRFWLARDTYQAVSPTQSLVFINAVRHYLTTPGLAFTFFPCAEPDFWLPVFTYADLTHLPEADFEVGGKHYGVYGHDWRAVPPMIWLSLLAERETATEIESAAPPAITESLVVLSRPDFETAIRQVLQNANTTHSAALANNPLLRSRLVVEQVGTQALPTERIAALQSLVRQAATGLEASPREVKFYRALYHTYFQPASTQEQAAELLDVPFSTYRRYLKTGINRLIEILWEQEVGGTEK